MFAGIHTRPWRLDPLTLPHTLQRNAVATILQARLIHLDHRNRLSKSYVPVGATTDKDSKADEDSHSKLIRAGFLRQAQSGVFHMLPLGFRVQEKIKMVIDRHLRRIGASRLSLSTFSSPSLWKSSGRYDKIGQELFQLSDRKDAKLLLSPTHEEEITTLINQTVLSYKSLPVRVYQITRKYRDEFRPRKGLLRSREFVMKDLYTFDLSVNKALETYKEVRLAYDNIFRELRLPIIVAEASSGDIGGDLSHEYHLPISLGEDQVFSCNNCGYVANSEVAKARSPPEEESKALIPETSIWRGVSKDRSTLVNVWYRGPAQDINIHAVKRIIPDIDASVEHGLDNWRVAVQSWGTAEADQSEEGSVPPVPRVVNLIDNRFPKWVVQTLQQGSNPVLPRILHMPEEKTGNFSTPAAEFISHDADGEPLNLLKIQDGDLCPKCDSGTLTSQKAIELGHTFHLGDRYSDPMKATVKLPPEALDDAIANGETFGYPVASSANRGVVNMQMGCHGIGISRIIGAVAEHLADARGLNWPRAIAPYEVVVVPGKDAEQGAEEVYDVLAAVGDRGGSPSSDWQTDASDILLDDRDKSLPWKLKDADLVGYPVIVVVGSEWALSRRCEVQCRRLGVRELVPMDQLSTTVNSLLQQL